MKLVKSEQITVDAAVVNDVDLIITASGFEDRATHIAKSFSIPASAAKWCFGFKDRQCLSRSQNDSVFSSMGFNQYDLDGNDCESIGRELKGYLANCVKDKVTFLIDYSSMTRGWYASVIKLLHQIEVRQTIEILFCYAPSEFSPPQPAGPNTAVGPIEGFCSLSSPDEPTALIIGLGYESDRALGLVEYVDPAEIYLFYTDITYDSRFKDEVLKNNYKLIGMLPNERLFGHPLGDLNRTSLLLSSLCTDLCDSHRVIIAPLGVKPFSLLSLILASRLPKVDIWRVSGGSNAKPQDRKAAGPILALRTLYHC